MSSPNRQYKIMNTFDLDECKYISKKMKGYGLDIKYNSFNEINKKYLTRQTKQELYDTCVAQKKEIEELKKQVKKPKSVSSDNSLLEKYKEKCIELKKENDKLYKIAEGKNKIYDRELFDDNKEFAEENLELLEGIEERDVYIKNVEDIVRKLDVHMTEQKKKILVLEELNEGISEELEKAEEQNEKYDKQIETIEDELHDSYKKQILGLKSEIQDYRILLEEATSKIRKEYENKIKNREGTISSLQQTVKKLEKTVKEYEVVSPFLDKKQIQKTVKKNEVKQKKEKVQRAEIFKSSPEKKVVKKSIYEKKYSEMNDILSKYS